MTAAAAEQALAFVRLDDGREILVAVRFDESKIKRDRKGRFAEKRGVPGLGDTPGNPIDCGTDVDRAAQLLGEGKYVKLDEVREVSTLLNKLGEMASDAIKRGGKAPTYDLCKVSVPKTNLFCAKTKGVPRAKMPQLGGIPIPGSKADKLPKNDKGGVELAGEFEKHLRSKGIKITDETEKAEYLKATQNQLNGAKVAGIAGAIRDGVDIFANGGLFVSESGYVIDGHHRWAAVVGVDTDDGVLGDKEMPVRRIHADILFLLDEANKFAEDWGIPQAAVGQIVTGGKAFHEASVYSVDAFDEKLHPRDQKGRFRKVGFGQLNLPGLTPPPESTKPKDTLADRMATMKMKPGSWKPLGSGTSTTYKAELEDGTPVLVKARLTSDFLRDEVAGTRGLEHAKAAERVADYLGVPTPRVANRTIESLGDIGDSMVRENLGFRDNEDVQVQEWMDDFEGPDFGTPDKAEVERFSVLDAIIGNTDRHDGNFGYRDGKLTAIDMDLTFPQENSEPWGNFVEWFGEDTSEPIWREALSPELKKKIFDMVKRQSEWEEKLREDGLTPEEREAMWNRVFKIEDSLMVPYPPEEIGEPSPGEWRAWDHYYAEAG